MACQTWWMTLQVVHLSQGNCQVLWCATTPGAGVKSEMLIKGGDMESKGCFFTGRVAAAVGLMKVEKEEQLQSAEAEQGCPGQGSTWMRQQVGRKAGECQGCLSLTDREGALIRTNKDHSPAGRHWWHRPIPQRW